MSKKPKHQPIRTTLDTFKSESNARVGGWFSGRSTYLRFAIGEGVNDKFMGVIGDYKLYRLAKAIVRQYESDKK